MKEMIKINDRQLQLEEVVTLELRLIAGDWDRTSTPTHSILHNSAPTSPEKEGSDTTLSSLKSEPDKLQ